MSKHNVLVMLNMYRNKGAACYKDHQGAIRWAGLCNLTHAERSHALGLDAATVLDAMKMQGVFG